MIRPVIRTGARKASVKPDPPAPTVTPAASAPDPFDWPSYADMPAYEPPTSLHVYENLDQGSPEWFAARCGIVTASVVGLLITTKTLKPASNDTSRGLTATLAAERITGHVEPSATSRDMERGKLDEPFARDYYSEHHAPATEMGFMVRDFGGYKLGYSPDGLVGDDGLIEIKSRAQKKHLATILADAVPAENMAQCQAGLLASGRDWIDYVSFCSGMPLWTKRVYPDTAWHEAIKETAALFETNAAAMINTYLTAVKGLPETERLNHFEDLEIF